MAYVKLYKVVQDSPVGFQTVNQAALNNDEMRTQMAVEHGTRELLLPITGVDYSRLGKHDLEEIARTVGNSALTIQSNLSIASSLSWTGPGIPWVWRWSTGFYYLPVLGLAQWFVTSVALAGTSVTYLPPQVRSFYANATNGWNSGIWVSTLTLSAGDFVPVDSAFSFALYGTV